MAMVSKTTITKKKLFSTLNPYTQGFRIVHILLQVVGTLK